MKQKGFKVISFIVFVCVMLLGFMYSTALTTYATDVSGVCYTSNLATNGELVLTGDTTLYVNTDLTLNSISGDYELDIQGDGVHTLTINNSNGSGIDVLSFSCSSPLNVTAKTCAINAEEIILNDSVTVQGGNGYYAIYAENDIIFEGADLNVKGSSGICTTNGDISINGSNISIISQDGASIISYTGKVDIDSDYLNVQCLGANENVTWKHGIRAAKNITIVSNDATIVGEYAIDSNKGNVSITGVFSVGAVKAAIIASEGSITLNGDITAQAGEGFYAIYSLNDIMFNGKNLDIKAYCGLCTIDGDVIIDADKVSIMGQDGVGIISYVGSVDINSDYIFIQCLGLNDKNTWMHGIRAEKDITIVSKDATIVGNYGINNNKGNVSLTGTFWIGAKRNAVYTVEGNIIINGNLTAANTEEEYFAIASDKGNIVIQGGSVDVTTTGMYALCVANGNILIDKSMELMLPTGGNIGKYSIEDANGVPAKYVNIATVISDDTDIMINSPVGGEKPVYSVNEIYGLNKNSSVKSITWYENGTEFKGSVFTAGKSYMVKVVLSADTGYVFNKDVKATVNSGTANISVNADKKELTITYSFGVCQSVIKKVDLTITAPVDGNNISYSVTDESAAYYVTNNMNYVHWYVSNDGINYMSVNSGDKFVGGKYYKVEIEVLASSGYEFVLKDIGTIQPDVSASVNGYNATVIKTYDQDPAENITILFNFGLCNDTIIEAINIVDVPKPVPGENPVYSVNILGTGYSIRDKESSQEVYENGAYVDKFYIRNGIGWYDLTADRWMFETDTFVAGHDYELYVYLITNSGNTFACDQYYEPTVTAKVNGNQAEVSLVGKDALTNQTINYTFIYEVQEISNVEVLDIDVPVGNLTPDYDGILGNSGLYEFADYGCELAGFWWYDSQGNVLNKNDKFVLGEVYMLEIKLVRKMDGQRVLTKFKAPVTASVNGKCIGSENVLANENTMYIYCTYLCDTEYLIEIDEADVTVTAPAVGKKPNYLATGNSNSDKYIVTVNYWFADDSQKSIIGTNELFKKNVSYGVKVTFTPKEGYKFTDKTVYKINGKDVTTWGHSGQKQILFAPIKSGLCIGNDGKWYYYDNNKINTSYTGMAANEYGVWYVNKGVLDRTYTGMAFYGGKWIYVNKGKYDTTYTGMAKNSAGWWYINKGNLDRTYTGMAKNSYGVWYMKAGKLDTTYTGMVLYGGKWIYVNKGKYDTTYTGMAKNSAGWWYIKNGNLDRTYTGMAKNSYGVWYMKNGKLDTTYTGMVLYGGKWIYVNKGKYDTTYTGMAKNSAGWWYINKGNLDRTYTGIATNSYGTWYMQKGKLDMTFSGKVTISGKTYTIKNGKVI